MNALLKRFFISAVVALAPNFCDAQTVRWELVGVVFDDGGTADGWFEWDPNTDAIGRYSIFTTAGSGPVGAHVYTPRTGTSNRGYPLSPSAAKQNQFYETQDNFYLDHTPIAELSATGGADDLNLSLLDTNNECNNCGIVRLITSGQLVGITDGIFGDGFD
jgi:hypothetical protein